MPWLYHKESQVTGLAEQQIDEFGRRLQARAAQLQEEIRSLDDEAGEAAASASLDSAGASTDRGDEANRGEHATRTAVRHVEKERDQRELRQIADAIERLRAGTYGQCGDCGFDIAFQRLQALPSAERCMPCQERHEREHPVTLRMSLTS